jgi:hypothetical protein
MKPEHLEKRMAFATMFYQAKRPKPVAPVGGAKGKIVRQIKPKVINKPKIIATSQKVTPKPQAPSTNNDILLHQFDVDRTFGPRMDISRKRRLQRADRFGIPVPDAMRQAILMAAPEASNSGSAGVL